MFKFRVTAPALSGTSLEAEIPLCTLNSHSVYFLCTFGMWAQERGLLLLLFFLFFNNNLTEI